MNSPPVPRHKDIRAPHVTIMTRVREEGRSGSTPRDSTEMLPSTHAAVTYVSGIPRKSGVDKDVEEKHSEDVVERETVFALAGCVGRNSLR